MIQGRVIVSIASSWDYDPTSKHHVMKLLARNNDVVWVNYHGTRRPGFNTADVRSAWSALRRFAGGVRRVTPNMVQVTPLVIPGASRRGTARISQALLAWQIRKAIRAVDPQRAKPVQIWTFAPDVGELAGRFDEECLVYYCVDEFAEFTGVDRERIRSSESALLAAADMVITTSQRLYESRRGRRPDTVLLRHGVDYDHFARAWREPSAEPEPLATVPRPIFGFFGMIHDWVDLELVAATARLRPHYSFVLLGEPLVDTTAVRRVSNVYLLGRRPYAELPAYCAQFAAGMIPFARTKMTENVNPIKLFEYLAAGLPVVSTSIPEAARMGGSVRVADAPSAFARACDSVAGGVGVEQRKEISRQVSGDTWASRVESLSSLITERIGGGRRLRGVQPAAREHPAGGPHAHAARVIMAPGTSRDGIACGAGRV